MKNGHIEIVKLLIPRTDLSKISDPRIIDIAKEMDLPPHQASYIAFSALMKSYSIKEVDIETGKQFNVVLGSDGDICTVCCEVSILMNKFQMKKVRVGSGYFDAEFN